MDGSRLIGGNGEGGLLDHGAQGLFRQGHRVFLLDLRQLRKIRRGQTDNIEVGVAAVYLDGQLVVALQGQLIVRHTTHNVAKQPGVQHQLALFFHITGKACADAELHVVARNGQIAAMTEQQHTLKGRNGAFGRYGAGGC